VAQKHHKEVVGNVVVSGYALLFLSEVVGERRFEVSATGGQDHLMAVDGLALDHKRDIAELLLVQDRQEAPLVALLLVNK